MKAQNKKTLKFILNFTLKPPNAKNILVTLLPTTNFFGRHWHLLEWRGFLLLTTNYKLPSSPAKRGESLVAWMLLNFGDTLYYPYGGSSTEHKDVMASNLVAWEVIKLGKKMNLKVFDMWGALGPEATDANPWYGFHRFKAGYGPAHVKYVGTYDLVLKPSLYTILNMADKLRWIYLRTVRR